MAEVYIEGLGNVQLEGNTPNAAEKEAIINALKTRNSWTTNWRTKTQSFTESTLNAFKSRDTSLAAGGMAGFASGARLGAMVEVLLLEFLVQ